LNHLWKNSWCKPPSPEKISWVATAVLDPSVCPYEASRHGKYSVLIVTVVIQLDFVQRVRTCYFREDCQVKYAHQ
jgi:hypothetical protein